MVRAQFAGGSWHGKVKVIDMPYDHYIVPIIYPFPVGMAEMFRTIDLDAIWEPRPVPRQDQSYELVWWDPTTRSVAYLCR